jgi:hypothetical protein
LLAGFSEANGTVLVDENLVMRKLGKTAQQAVRPRQANHNASAAAQSVSNRDEGTFEKLIAPRDRNTRNFGIQVFEGESVALDVWRERLPGLVRVSTDDPSRHLLGERVNEPRAPSGVTSNHQDESPLTTALERLPHQLPVPRREPENEIRRADLRDT